MLPYLFDSEFIRLITFRAAMAAVAAFLLCLLLGPRVIAFLRRRRIGERIEKNESPALDRLMDSKKNTPTMGGVFVVAAIILSVLAFGNFENPALLVILFVVVALGIVGAADDALKLTGANPRGMSMFAKLTAQVLIGFAAGYMLHHALLRQDPAWATRLFLPWGGSIDLGVYFPTFVMLVVVSCSNAVNITDGLDGLAGGCLVLAVLAYAVLSYAAGRVDFSHYLGIPYVHASAEATVVCTAMAGACLGFLWFNGYPAQVFLGDAGSLPLGGALGLIACVTKHEALLFVIGGVFVVEVFSSLVQILSFKMFRKRIFLIAPLHHHFQFKGVSEPKITLRFWIVSAILAVTGLAVLKLR